jgi:hypothetical protein
LAATTYAVVLVLAGNNSDVVELKEDLLASGGGY